LTDQFFDEEVLIVAKAIRIGKPKTAQHLENIILFNRFAGESNFNPRDIKEMAPLMLPYFTGAEKISYQIQNKDVILF
jgi:transposase